MNIIWKYFPNNIGQNRLPVAKMLTNNGTLILKVFEVHNYLYTVLIPRYDFIEISKTKFSDESLSLNLSNNQDYNLETNSVLLEKLKNGCSFIEENFLNQLAKYQKV